MDILRDVMMSKIRGENGNIKEKKRKQWESWRKSHNEEKIETGEAKKRSQRERGWEKWKRNRGGGGFREI